MKCLNFVKILLLISLPFLSLAQVAPISFITSPNSSQSNQIAGNALDFDGTNDYISIPSTAGVPIGNSTYTIEAYIKPSVHSNNGIIGWGTFGSGNRVNAFRLGGSNQIINYWWGNDLTVTLTSSLGNNWYHVAATYDGSKRRIYLNGVLQKEDSPTGLNVSSASNLRIGSTNNGEYFKGSIDEVRVWNIARTQAQIQESMNTELVGNEVGLKLYYTFNQGIASGTNTSINNVFDKVSGTFFGTLTNFNKSGATSNFVTGKVPLPKMDGLTASTASTSAYQIKQDFPHSADGVYWIKNSSINSGNAFQIYADMTTDGGGWMLVLNYLHKGGTNPNLLIKTSNFPLLGSTNLGGDESLSTSTWGHISPATLNAISFSQLRFYGKTSAHTRVIHFKTEHPSTLNYFKTGIGDMNGIASNFISLNGHTANLPQQSNDYFTDQNNEAMTNFPFWLSSTYHWGIKGLGYRWEVDDFPNNESYDTFHQIWIR